MSWYSLCDYFLQLFLWGWEEGILFLFRQWILIYIHKFFLIDFISIFYIFTHCLFYLLVLEIGFYCFLLLGILPMSYCIYPIDSERWLLCYLLCRYENLLYLHCELWILALKMTSFITFNLLHLMLFGLNFSFCGIRITNFAFLFLKL